MARWQGLSSSITWGAFISNSIEQIAKQNKNEKTRWLTLLSVFGVILLLAFLVSKSMSINFEQHQKYQNTLNQQKEQEVLLNLELLRSRYELFPSYDLLNQHLSVIEQTNEQLLLIPKFIAGEGKSVLVKQLEEQSQLLKQKEILLERFKAQNSVLKNSLRYLPSLTIELVHNASSQTWNRTLAVTIDQLLQQILLYNLTSSENLESLIEQNIDKLSQLQDQSFESKDKSLIELTITHSRIILKNKPKVERLTQELLELPVSERIQKLEQVYNSDYQKALTTASTYRLYAYYWSLIVLAGITYLVIYKLVGANRHTAEALEKVMQAESALHKLNEQLEIRVKERTAQLLASNKMFLESNKRSQLLRGVTLNISRALEAQSILDTAVQQIHNAIKSDRVLVYQFDENDKIIAIAKSTQSSWSVALGEEIANPCFDAQDIEKYQQGWVHSISDIYQANLSQKRLKQLELFGVRAYLVAPILIGGELRQLLIAHQCSSPRHWGPTEIYLFRQVAAQVGLALEHVNLLEQQRLCEKKQRRAKEHLERGALQLLKDIAPISRGDLTVRAQVGSDEIGTIAGSYNSMIEDLGKIVLQVQTAAQQLSSTTQKNESVVEALSEEAWRQSGEISLALSRIQAMVASIQAVAVNAERAEIAVQEATQTAQEGDRAMNQTVEGMMAIQERVIETVEKIKRLAKTSHKISPVVNLISSLAEQTRLLALNASLEAAQAGKEGLGFSAVADRVGLLAQQSAKATADIEKLVTEIQEETHEVVVAMKAGKEQVAAETQMVTQTRQTLNQITEVSQQISELVDEIAQATEKQSQASNLVYPTMLKAAGIVSQTSTLTTEVSASFKELLTLAETLQKSVSQFKVS